MNLRPAYRAALASCLAAAFALACASATATESETEGKTRPGTGTGTEPGTGPGTGTEPGTGSALPAVLLIGNSLTYSYDLPGMLRAVAAASGEELRVGMAAAGNTAVIDHINGATDALAQIRGSEWSFVVLQQGPTPPGVCRDTLIMAAVQFAPLVAAAGGRVAIFSPWARLERPQSLVWGSESAELAARAVGGAVVPIGAAWQAALAEDAALPLYELDGYHPARAGTLLTALTLYARLFERDVRTIPPAALAPLVSGGMSPLTSPQIGRLIDAAHSASTGRAADPRTPVPPTYTGPDGGPGPC